MSKSKKRKKRSSKIALNKKLEQNKKTNEMPHLLCTTAEEYHRHYTAEIAYEIEFHNHLSVLMPAMIGLYPLALNLYNCLDFRCREYVIVEKQEDIDEINGMLIGHQSENDCIYPILYESFLERRPVGGCYVLFDLSQEKRLELSSFLVHKKDVKVISIGRLKRK